MFGILLSESAAP